jgi:hypothetical protein
MQVARMRLLQRLQQRLTFLLVGLIHLLQFRLCVRQQLLPLLLLQGLGEVQLLCCPTCQQFTFILIILNVD